ncbi:hypothetical protein SK069_01410 [Patulibacter brassicae]|uniref:RNA polymerase subunit sigma-70 n=1 Tax=Patulibacter brassicae TaxID=1705717 RepID=A0ABU4VEU3_9ACTN|nr:hypothetical protein [Patulibacter brassicae]MDX8150239.1 hypothetical protein [Patulibacter brassicae]
MPRVESLHPDQQAVLQLVLRRGMAYEELAGALGMTPELVRERALDAVDGLAPDDVDGLEIEDRDRIADYLLGQSSASERQAVRELLESAAPARTWARLVSNELRPLAGDRLPVVPGDGEDVREAFAALDAKTVAQGKERRRRGAGSILLALAGALVLVVAVLYVTGVFDGDDDASDVASTPTTTTTAGSSDAELQAIAQSLRQQVNLRPPSGAKGSAARPKGVIQLTAQDGQLLALLQGSGFRPATSNRTYAVWLTGGPSSRRAIRLGWFSNGETDQSGQATAKTIDSKGRIAGTLLPLQVGKDIANQREVPIDPRQYSRIVIAEETSSTVGRANPGRTVVSGPLKQ